MQDKRGNPQVLMVNGKTPLILEGLELVQIRANDTWWMHLQRLGEESP